MLLLQVVNINGKSGARAARGSARIGTARLGRFLKSTCFDRKH